MTAAALGPFLVALAGAGLAAAAGRRRPRLARRVAVVMAAACLAAALGAAAGGGVAEIPWAPSWGARAVLEMDPLGALLGLAAAGVGLAVVVYSAAYIPGHLEEGGRPAGEQSRYFAWLLLFLAAMVGLATARDLLSLFVFFELTAVCSYFLIAFDVERPEARRAALMALVVTGSTALALLVAALLLQASGGTLDLAGLRAADPEGPAVEWAAALLVVAALGKSAQPPLHFWLPRAMAAPTPVSAFLHSAAMVAAGVFLLLRVAPLLEGTAVAGWLPFLGLGGIAVGGGLALGADVLKQLLAYSTVAQYGFVVLLVGWGLDGRGGTEAALAAAALYVLAHALAKSALFLTAGAVTRATGEDRLSRLGGLTRRLPRLAAGGGVAAAALAGLPPTIGWFKDEALLETALERGPLWAAAAAAAVALTFAYTARFWIGTFVGGAAEPPVREAGTDFGLAADVERPAEGGAEEAAREPEAGSAAPVPAGLWMPVAALSAAALAGGLAPGLLSRISEAAGGAAAGGAAHLDLSYGLHPATALAAGAYALGALLYLSRRTWIGTVHGLHRLGARAGPEAWYERGMAALNRLSDRMHALEVRGLRDRVAALLVPAGLLVLAAVVGVGGTPWDVGELRAGQLPLLAGLAVAALAALAATRLGSLLVLVLALTAVGYTLAAVYALLGAGDVALVAALVETALTLLFLGVLGLLPPGALRREGEEGDVALEGRRRRHRAAGLLAGAAAFVVAWSALSAGGGPTVAETHVALAERVHAADPVAAILSDFRGLDTLAEVSVLVAALLGLYSLLPTSGEEHGPGARARGEAGAVPAAGDETSLVRLVVRMLLPAALVVSLAFLLQGHAGTGGGFAAALVAATGVLYGFLALGVPEMGRLAPVRLARALCGAGLASMLAVGFGPTAAGHPPFSHFPAVPPEPPGLGSLHLHSGFLFEVGIFLLAFGFLVAALDRVFRAGDGMPGASP